jgi:hypothetical protein
MNGSERGSNQSGLLSVEHAIVIQDRTGPRKSLHVHQGIGPREIISSTKVDIV